MHLFLDSNKPYPSPLALQASRIVWLCLS